MWLCPAERITQVRNVAKNICISGVTWTGTRIRKQPSSWEKFSWSLMMPVWVDVSGNEVSANNTCNLVFLCNNKMQYSYNAAKYSAKPPQ